MLVVPHGLFFVLKLNCPEIGPETVYSSEGKAVSISIAISDSVRSGGSDWCCLKKDYRNAYSTPPAGFSTCVVSR
jgi:hypothetical protein